MKPLVSMLVLLSGLAAGHDVITTAMTWDRQISRIVYQRCALMNGQPSLPSVPLSPSPPYMFLMKRFGAQSRNRTGVPSLLLPQKDHTEPGRRALLKLDKHPGAKVVDEEPPP